MFSNVLGYLCPKGQDGGAGGHPLRRSTTATAAVVPDTDGPLQENSDYGIEDQDDWQIVRKMSDASFSSEDGEVEQEDCLDDGSGEALFALAEDGTLEIELPHFAYTK